MNMQDDQTDLEDITEEDDETEAESRPDELTLLKQRASAMGIKFSNNIGIDALRAKISAQLDDTPLPETTEAEDGFAGPVSKAAKRKNMTVQQIRREQRREQLRLVRIRVACMNPNKRELTGEFFTVANRFIGTVSKMVPFGEQTDNGYHVPYCIYNMMKERKFLSVKTRPDPRNKANLLVEERWMPEFSIEVLPPLTEKEISRLAAQQAAAEGLQEV